jgi:predicted transcriptional regulator
MDDKAFRAALETLGMNGQDAADFLRVSQATVSRYSRGLQPISGPVAKLLEDALAAREAAK